MNKDNDCKKYQLNSFELEERKRLLLSFLFTFNYLLPIGRNIFPRGSRYCTIF